MFEKVLRVYTRYMAVWVVLFGVVAYFAPGIFTPLKPGNELFFAITMFGIGVVLQVDDFRAIARRPVIVLIGSVAQFTIMPLGAFFCAKLFHLPGDLAVGLILTGSAPGAMASNVMSYVAKADTAYSVSLTTVSTLLCPILTPLLTYLLAKGTTMDVAFWPMVWSVSKMVVLPLLAGFAFRHFFRRKVEKILPVFPALSATFIIFICSLVIALNVERISHLSWIILAAVATLNIYGTLGGYGVGKLFRFGVPQRRTLAIEIGMQNAGLGTTLALAHISEEAALPAAIFVFVCIITASAMASYWQRRDAAAGANAA